MSSTPEITEVLSLISQPAFFVLDDQISECNDAALRLLIAPGTAISNYIPYESLEYDTFKNGCLILPLQINHRTSSATVTLLGNGRLFVLDAEDHAAELKTLSLTAENMRQPLSAMIASSNSLSHLLDENQDPKVSEHMQQFNRNLYQMHRMLCNMSDVIQYADGVSKYMVCQNIVSLAEAIFQKVQTLAAHCGLKLEYSVPDESILCTIDEQLLERGILNMISNAIKFSEKGGTIHASLFLRGKTAYISVTDHGPGIPAPLMGSVFHRYRRQPGLEDGRYGLGLGLTLVRSAAIVHGGTVLIDRPNQAGTRITISIPIRQGDALLRSDRVTIDYAGGWDHALLELSDVLPANLYQMKN